MATPSHEENSAAWLYMGQAGTCIYYKAIHKKKLEDGNYGENSGYVNMKGNFDFASSSNSRVVA